MRGRTLRTGTTVVTVTFKNIKTAKSTAKKYRCVVKAAIEQKPEEPATTAAKITAIKQTSATKLAAEFSADMTGIKYTDLKIVRDKTGAVVTVKSATVDSKDNTKVTIETYEALTDGEAYTVTYTATDEAKTESSATFTATAGVVADIALNTYSVPANTPTEIKYQLLDANGVLIEEKGIGKSKSDKVDISIENFNGYQNDNNVTLYKTGDTATLKVVYHTWKYNNTDGTEEGKVEKEFKITAVDPSSVIETYEYSVVNSSTGVVDFKRDTLKTQLAIGDDDSNDPHAKFSFRKADGTDITKSLDYTVASGNENVLLVSGTVAEGAKLTPVAAGATYLVIKNASGSVVKTLPITVVAKRSLSTMSVDKANISVASSMTDTSGKQTLTISVMDQYSDAYSNFVAENIERKSSTNPVGLKVYFDGTTKNKVSISADTAGVATPVTEGTYTYTVDLRDTKNDNNVKKVSFSVTVSKNLTDASNKSLALVMMNSAQDSVVSKVDTTVTTDTFSATTLVPTIVVKNNGSITGKATTGATGDVVSIGALSLKKNGTEVSNKKIYKQTGNNFSLANNGDLFVKVTEGTGASATPAIKNLDPGTYTVSLTAYLGGTKYQTMSTSFVVEDSQKVFEINVKKESVTDQSTLAGIFNSGNKDYVTFSYAGHELDSNFPYSFADADYTKNNNGSLNVKKVSVDVLLPGTNNQYVRMTTNVNRTFTFSNGVTLDKDAVAAKIATFKKDYVSGSAIKDTLSLASEAALITEATAINTAVSALTSAQQATFTDDLALISTVVTSAQADIDAADAATAQANADADVALAVAEIEAFAGSTSLTGTITASQVSASAITVCVTTGGISVVSDGSISTINSEDDVEDACTGTTVGISLAGGAAAADTDEITVTYEVTATNIVGSQTKTAKDTVTLVYTYSSGWTVSTP